MEQNCLGIFDRGPYEKQMCEKTLNSASSADVVQR